MINVPLSEQRCEKCHRLLFKGLIGLGVVEVKCTRCGHLNLLHSFEELFRSQPDAYIIVFASDGKIVAASRTAEHVLGYSEQEFAGLSLSDLAVGESASAKKLDEIKAAVATTADGSLLARKADDVRHRTKDGAILPVKVRYYPFGSVGGEYTLGIYSPRQP